MLVNNISSQRRIIVILSPLILTSCGIGQIPQNKTPGDDASFPNIIYILADDMGYGDISSLNPGSLISTPNLDRIVSEGVHFTDAHSNSSVCTPTRYGILTGRYAFRSRLKQRVIWGYSPPLIEKERATVASYLKQHGYHTACIGKWHLGLGWVKKNPEKEIPDIPNLNRHESPREFEDNVDFYSPVEGGPAHLGFDYSFIIPASLDMMPYCYVLNDRVVETPSCWTDGKDPETEGRGVLWREGKMAPSFDFDQVLPAFIDSACSYIRGQAEKRNPFFLYLALTGPHTPWLPLDDYKGLSGAGRYGDFVAMIDDLTGKILYALDELNINDNTLIIFTSDNGSDWKPEDIEEFDHKANYIYRGRKADIYEGGHRIPFIAKWDGVISAGHRSDQIMCTTDLFATIAGMLNMPFPEKCAEDSYNLWPAFTGTPDSLIRKPIIHHSSMGFFAIRKGEWKYAPQLGSGGNSDPKIIDPPPGGPNGTLFNIKKDPEETENLYNKYPEIVNDLDQLLKQIKQGSLLSPCI